MDHRFFLGMLLIYPLFAVAALASTSAEYDHANRALQKAQYNQAYKFANKALKSGDPRAHSLLGYMSFKGQGTQRNLKKAVKHYLEAVKLGDNQARFHLGLISFEAGAPIGLQEGETYLTVAAENGHVEAMRLLGLAYSPNGKLPRNEEKAVQWLTKAADKGDERAHYALGLQALSRDAVGEATPHFLAAARKGHAASALEYGFIRYGGRDGKNADKQVAACWFLSAASENNAEAMAMRAQLLAYGLGVEKNYETSYRWLKRWQVYSGLADEDANMNKLAKGLEKSVPLAKRQKIDDEIRKLPETMPKNCKA